MESELPKKQLKDLTRRGQVLGTPGSPAGWRAKLQCHIALFVEQALPDEAKRLLYVYIYIFIFLV